MMTSTLFTYYLTTHETNPLVIFLGVKLCIQVIVFFYPTDSSQFSKSSVFAVFVKTVHSLKLYIQIKKTM